MLAVAAWSLHHTAASSPFGQQGPVDAMDIQVPGGLNLIALESAGEGCLGHCFVRTCKVLIFHIPAFIRDLLAGILL